MARQTGRIEPERSFLFATNPTALDTAIDAPSTAAAAA
jgi:hypothetical protein